jgi:hypothetical protein
MLYREPRVMLLDVIAGFAEDLQVADHLVLHQLVLQESYFIQQFSITGHEANWRRPQA